jgi:hypothetical protein
LTDKADTTEPELRVNGVVRRLTAVVMAGLMFLNTACYSYVPLATGAVPAAGDQVRVRLSAAGTSELASALGPSVEWAEGLLSERRADGTLLVGVVQVRLRDGLDRFWSGSNAVAIAPSQFAEVQRKTLDKGKSRMASIVLAGALVAIALVALGTGGAGGGPGDGGPQPPP